MKFRYILSMLALGAASIFTACKSDSDAVRDAAVQSAQPGQPAAGDAAAATTQPATPPAEPAQNAAGVWHYTCPKGCAGGAGSAAACATCGSTLAHNQAYHAGANAAPTPTQTTLPAISDKPNSATSLPPGMVPVDSPLKNTEAAQNAKGVWHYTCPGGCAGGAGLAVACTKCGKTLAHNQAYHQ